MKYSVIFLIFIIFESSSALICKRCKDLNDPSCKETIDETCPAATNDSPKEAACLTHIYEDATKKENVEKKCVIKEKKQDFQCIPLAATREIKCVTCNDKDGCNSGNSLKHLASLSTLVVGISLVLFR